MIVHTLLNADTNMPFFITYTAAALHHQQFYKYIKELPDDSKIAFDKSYINYKQFDAFTARDIYYVSRQKDNANYKSMQEFDLAENVRHILKNERLEVTCTVDKVILKQQMCRVAVFSE